MKLRLRYQNTTKVLTIPEDVHSFYTLEDVRSATLELFEGTLSGFTPFQFSLNKKDVLDDETKTLSDYDIVSGDLVFIVSEEDSQVSQSTSSASMATVNRKSDSSLTSSSSVSECKKLKDTDDEPMPSISASSSSTVSDTCMDHISNIKMVEDHEAAVDRIAVKQFLSEPRLCREVTGAEVPALLLDVYTSLRPTDPVDALCVVLHVMMLETGYKVKPEEAEASASNTGMSSKITTQWKFPGRAMFQYIYPGCVDFSCSLSLIPVGHQLICHGKVTGDDSIQTRQITLKPSDFIKEVNPDAAGCYCNLIKLSMMFKDTVTLPLLQDLRTYAGVLDLFGFMALTQEVKLKIIGYLDVVSVEKLSEVNTEMLTTSRDPYIWRRLFLREFGGVSDNSLAQDWRKLYIEKNKERKTRRKMMSQARTFIPVIPPLRNPYPCPWLPPGPGMVGGDYDLDPNPPGVLPGMPPMFGTRPRPRIDLIGPYPDQDPLRNPGRMGGGHRGGRGRGSPFGGGFGPRFY